MRGAHKLPLSQLETMTLSYIPLFAITYFFWWLKPKDVMTPSVVNLPDMLPEQRLIFESMAVSSVFDIEGAGNQNSLWTIWYLTPRVFEKEAMDRELHEAQQKQSDETGPKAEPKAREDKISQITSNHNACLSPTRKPLAKEIVLAYWDPELYHSKILWPVICIFGASFGALHLICWNAMFPTPLEQWVWRAAALASISSMLIFMQFEKVVLRWGGLLTMTSLISPVLYLLSRIIMMGGVIAAFRASNPAVYDTYSISTYWIHIL